MRKIAGEQEVLIAGPLDLVRQAFFVALAADEHPPVFEVVARTLLSGRSFVFSAQVKLEMIGVRAIQAVHPERYPTGTAFQETHAQTRKLIEHAVINHTRKCNDERQRMA